MENGSASISRVFKWVMAIVGIILIALSPVIDKTPGFGVLQMSLILAGISLLTVGGVLHLHSLRNPNAPPSLQASIGLRLVATGLVFAFVTGLSDLLQIGTHVHPRFERPVVGPIQWVGFFVAIAMVGGGLLLYHTSRHLQESSLLDFLIPPTKKTTNPPQSQDDKPKI